MSAAGGGTTHLPRGVRGGVISVEELNDAIADEMRDGYERSDRVMEDKLRRLYKQLGLSRDPVPLPSNKFAGIEGKINYEAAPSLCRTIGGAYPGLPFWYPLTHRMA